MVRRALGVEIVDRLHPATVRPSASSHEISARVHAFERFTTKNTKHHEGARSASMLTHRDLSNRIIGLAIEVHRNVGPSLLESVYAECLSGELGQAGIPREVTVPV